MDIELIKTVSWHILFYLDLLGRLYEFGRMNILLPVASVSALCGSPGAVLGTPVAVSPGSKC